MSALESETRQWLIDNGFFDENLPSSDEAIWIRALTHGSFNSDADYERLEFLGDRVLGLVIAEWLYEKQSGPEGKLSLRLNALVSRKTCASIALKRDLSKHILLGKQARDDGGASSTNILGDVMEALLGAAFTQNGFAAARTLIRSFWDADYSGDLGRVKHPKSALQEWAAGNHRKPPEYDLVERTGPDHAAEFTVRVTVRNVGDAQASASSKGEAESRAAKAFMEQFG